MPDELPTAVERGSRFRLSLIWIVPLLAVMVGLGLAAKALLARGPEITLQFTSADGLEANKTRVKFKDVSIGTVTEIGLSDDHRSVLVTVQMDRQSESLVVEDTRFWVVRPRVAAGGVTGLATLLSGVYIAMDPGKSSERADAFVGLETPPQVTFDTPGRQFVLKAADLGSLDIGAPVYYRRIPVGRVSSYELQKDGKGVDVKVFVEAPHDVFVTTDTRFWHASGVDVSLNAEGVKVDMQSIASLIAGGIAFGEPDNEDETEAKQVAEANTTFILHPDRTAAMHVTDRIVQKYLLTFNESVRGLTVGASVDYRGLPVGEVRKIDLRYEKETQEFLIMVEINMYPERFIRRLRNQADLGGSRGEDVSQRILDRMVKRGFRAQLRSANLVSGQRYVALDFFNNAKPAAVDWNKSIPQLPTQPATLDSLQDQLLVIVGSLRKAVEHADALMLRMDKEVVPELAATLTEARKTLQNVDQTLASDSPTQVDLRDTLREVSKAAASIRNLTDMLEREPEALLKGKKGE